MKTRGAFACLFVLVVFMALAQRVPDVIDHPLLPGTPGAPVGVPLPFAATVGNESRRDLRIHVRDVAELERYDQVQLVFGTLETSPALEYGWLRVTGSGCSFQAPKQKLQQNGKVVFSRTGPCSAGSGPAEATLRLAMEGPARYARAAIWTSAPSPGTVPLLTVNAFDQVLGVAGRTVVQRAAPAVRRIELLAFMWDMRARWIAMLLVIAGVLLTAGCAWTGEQSPRTMAAGSFALAAGLALFYAVLVPPLQAADEPDHLLAFWQVAGRPEQAAAESGWAKRIHFFRMTFMGDERFTPADREQPYARDWPEQVFAEDVTRRSSTATRLWQGLARLAPSSPPHALLAVRGTAALLFGAAFAAGAAALGAAAAGAPVATLLAPILLSVPTLAFFGMQMSELTLTIGGFVLLAYGAVMVMNGAPGRLSGPLLGLAAALIATGPRNGWPALLIVAALAAAHAATAVDAPPPSARDRLWFWAGLAIPGVVLIGSGAVWVPSPAYDQWHLGRWDPRRGLSSASFLVLVTAGGTAGALGEWTLTRARALLGWLPSVMRAATALTAVWILGVLAWSTQFALPTITARPPLEMAKLSAGGYTRTVLAALSTWPRVRGFDFLSWTSLWGGFGWADAILPTPLIALVTIGAAIGAAATLINAARGKGGATTLVAVLGGLFGAAGAAAVFSFALGRNIHGRYLLGACVVAVAALVAPSVAGRMVSRWRTAAILALTLAIHTFALRFLLGRYFG